MNDENPWRGTIPPHCYRVVQLGLTLRPDAAHPLAERASSELTHEGRLIRASSLFEPIVGGGGLLLLVDEENGATWARVLVEPDGPVMSLAAAILDADWESSDEAIAAKVRAWVTALHGKGAGSVEPGGNGSATNEFSGPVR
jgi:hypothetical protein